jgi:HK97 family phage prohead protease
VTLLSADHLVKPVAGDDDLIQFRQDFTLAGKSLEDGTSAQTITEDANGDLIIEGYAAVFDGLDREGENFVEGAFQRGIKSFLGGQAALCYHHKHDQVIGKVLDLQEEEGKGLFMRARVDKQVESSPLWHIYNGIKKGTINGLSVGGFFKRAVVAGRKMIADMDFTEISTTGVPVHAGTNFAVVAGKALASDIQVPASPEVADETEIREDDLRAINYLFEELDAFFRRIEDSVGQRKTDPTDAGL